MIVRFKSMYLLLGGDMNALQKEGYLENIVNSNEEAMGLRNKSKSKSSKKSNVPPIKMH